MWRASIDDMCHYCGCRQMPLIRDYVAEHEEALDLAGDAVRALDHGNVSDAKELLGRLHEELVSHWDGEENGLFEVMKPEPEYAEYIAPLVQDHRDLHELLTTVDLRDPSDQQRVRVAIEELREHILKEEDGLFPAAVVSLSGSDWEVAMAAWASAHPDRTPLEA